MMHQQPFGNVAPIGFNSQNMAHAGGFHPFQNVNQNVQGGNVQSGSENFDAATVALQALQTLISNCKPNVSGNSFGTGYPLQNQQWPNAPSSMGLMNPNYFSNAGNTQQNASNLNPEKLQMIETVPTAINLIPGGNVSATQSNYSSVSRAVNFPQLDNPTSSLTSPANMVNTASCVQSTHKSPQTNLTSASNPEPECNKTSTLASRSLNIANGVEIPIPTSQSNVSKDDNIQPVLNTMSSPPSSPRVRTSTPVPSTSTSTQAWTNTSSCPETLPDINNDLVEVGKSGSASVEPIATSSRSTSGYASQSSVAAVPEINSTNVDSRRQVSVCPYVLAYFT